MCVEQAIVAHRRWSVGGVDREGGVVQTTVRLGPVLSVEAVEVTVTPVDGGTALKLVLTPKGSPVRQATRTRMCEELLADIEGRLG